MKCNSPHIMRLVELKRHWRNPTTLLFKHVQGIPTPPLHMHIYITHIVQNTTFISTSQFYLTSTFNTCPLKHSSVEMGNGVLIITQMHCLRICILQWAWSSFTADTNQLQNLFCLTHLMAEMRAKVHSAKQHKSVVEAIRNRGIYYLLCITWHQTYQE
jgi:hypothetical protein